MVTKFNQFVAEAENKKPYKLVIFSHDDKDDPNETGALIRDKAEKLGIQTLLTEFIGLWIKEENNKLYVNSFLVDKKGEVEFPTGKDKETKYGKPFPIDPKDTLIMVRGLGTYGKSGNASWFDLTKDLEYRGFTVVNTTKCHDICANKFMSQIVFERHNIRTPKTVRISHVEGTDHALERLDVKFPIILKTINGSRGVGVVLVESAASLQSIVQLLYRENEFSDILLQENIKNDYDVRVIVVAGQVVGAMKRPVAKDDFRSNVSQGSEPTTHKLTSLEESESLRVAELFEGKLVGVDFIPAKNREKDSPYFIEVNSSPGLIGIEKALKSEGSITEKVLKTFMNRDNWT